MDNKESFKSILKKKLKLGNEEFLIDYLARATYNILNMNIKENKGTNFEIDIINYISDKVN